MVVQNTDHLDGGGFIMAIKQLSQDEKDLLIYWMSIWRLEAQQWIVNLDKAQKRKGTTFEKVVMLSNYFLTAAGHVYLHAQELERDKQGMEKKDVFKQVRSEYPVLKQLKDRRDMVTHGVLSRPYNYTSMRRATMGESDEDRNRRLKHDAEQWVRMIIEG